MAALPRKLLNNSSPDLDDPIAKYCKRFCDPQENPDGGCPIPCLLRCIPVCTHVIYEFPPPDYDADDLPDTGDHPGRPFGVSIFLSVSLAVLATVFVVFCFYSAYRFYRRRRSGPVQPHPGPDPGPGEEEQRGPWVDHPVWYIRTVGLEAAAIRAIAVCKYKKGEGLVEGTDCSVCLNEFEDGETIRLLPKCNHAFHIPCIDTWLSSHTNCPNCRAGIVRSGVPSLQNSGLNPVLLEESIPGNSESDNILEDEVGSGSAEASMEESVHGNGNGNGNGIGMQPLRRSVSVDSVAASMINASVSNAFSGKNKGGVSGETALSSSMEGSSVKRSLSCSAKVFLSRYSRSRASSLRQ